VWNGGRLFLDFPSFEAIFKLKLHREVCYVMHIRTSGNDKLADIQALEKKLRKTLIAFSCKSNLVIAELKDDKLSQIRQIEQKLNISLVAVK
jgi:hypothetical protein